MKKNILVYMSVYDVYTWKSPADTVNNIIRKQINFVLSNKRLKNSLKSVKAYPGAYVSSDRNPVVGQVNLKIKKLIQGKSKQNLDYNALKDPVIRQKVKDSMREHLKTIIRNQSAEEKCSSIKYVVLKTAKT